MKVGVISDTHGLLRPEALAALQGCELIVHAGDIGKPQILDALAALAPLQVVRGNNDLGLPWAEALEDVRQFDMGGWTTLLVHDKADVPDTLARDVRVVITGHSHKPCIDWREGRLYLNPGSAGPRRFKLPVSVALLEVSAREVAPRIVNLLE
ncbi:metallophosphatase family protein [Pseudomonas guariconensis]|uniref:metallophosphoesterase family protein n=1 Tax=Pseudomonas TaxID=286 RepID=UPI001CE3D87E|nr:MULTISPECIES: metallophosphoesterase family protein [Pseudomonas]MCO7514450.1 metallophosphatase family protein [Pseudomonas putida]MCO7595720.1 metallophosphatase family protein [Pseudomonas guariconensis]MCO7604503.1 metallophosphatase family protein [Pseudomonas guariconensis]MCO7633129.1 metallophosphatase family protein [Pseudomonas guariconensis]MCU7220373.1 metallophosphatase family protein [Pseudomonas brassicacearum]